MRMSLILWSRPRLGLIAHSLLAAIVYLASACAGRAKESGGAPLCTSQTYALLEANRARYEQAIDRGRIWLDGLHVDLFELRQHGIDGKKKFTEQLDGYYRLWQIAAPTEKAKILERIRDIVAVTYESRYHDLASLDDQHFKQDATSYLRVAVLMDRLGLDTQLYREEIRKIHPRLNAHMHVRGPNQRLAFHWYYRYFGLEEPFPLEDARKQGVIGRRLTTFTLGDVYFLTHEVFAPYEYGDRLDADPFDEEDKEYLREALEPLVARSIETRNPDLLAELIASARLLRFVELPAYRNGLTYLLESQQVDGSWGDLQGATQRFGEYGPHVIILHTTTVAMDALTLAFHRPWNRDLYPGCDSR